MRGNTRKQVVEEGLKDYKDFGEYKKKEKIKNELKQKRKERDFKERIEKKIKKLKLEIGDCKDNYELYKIKKWVETGELRNIYKNSDINEKKDIKIKYKEYLLKKYQGIGELRRKLLSFLKEKPDRTEEEIMAIAKDVSEKYLLN